MKTSSRIPAVTAAFLCFLGLEHGDALRATTVTVPLPYTLPIAGYAGNHPLTCNVFWETNSFDPPPYLKVGKETGLSTAVTNRVFLSFAPNTLLRNTNITLVQLQLNVIDVTNWSGGYQVTFHDFNTTSADCNTIWNDAADGTNYGQFNFVAQHGVNTASLNAAAAANLAGAMNAGQEFRLGMMASMGAIPDSRDLALISGYASANRPVLLVTYDCTPATPTNVVATGSCGAVGLTWTPVPGATNYQILRDGGLAGSSSTASFTDHPACGAHSYAIRALNGCGMGPASSSVSGTSGCTPGAPTAVVASDGTYCGYVQICWNAAAGATGYIITKDGGYAASSTTTCYTNYPGDTSLHTYAVSATNGCGATAAATPDSGWAAAPPPAPASLSASAGTSTNSVHLTWSPVAGAAAYEIWRNAVNDSGTAANLNVSVGGTNYSDSSNPPFITFYYWVKTRATCGASGFSPGASGWANAVPAMPGNVQATYGAYPNQIGVSWASVLGATAYAVYRNTSNNSGGAANIGSVGGTNYFSDTPPATCTPYWYWVKAASSVGASGYSTSAMGLAGTVPAMPTGLQATDGLYTNKVIVSWNNTAGATGYEVWRALSGNPGGGTRIAVTAGVSYEDTGVVACNHYTYWVIGTNSCTSGTPSAGDDGYAAAGPPAPAIVTATAGTYVDKVSVSWSPVSGATGYVVWTNSINSPTGAAALTGVLTATNYDDQTTPPATTNFYSVKAQNSCAAGDFSTWVPGYRGVPAQVTIQGTSLGVSIPVTIFVDGTSYGLPHTFYWQPGSCHTLDANAPGSAPGVRYSWVSWSDGGLANHQICPPGDTNCTATFTTQYALSVSAGAGGGTVGPASGFQDSGQTVQLTASPSAGYIFSGWTGTGASSYTGADNPATVIMNSPVSETALFTYTNPCTYALAQPNTSFTAFGGTGSVTVTTAPPCAWSLTNALFTNSSCSWLHATGTSGPGVVLYTVESNGSASSRICTLGVLGQLFTINQDGACVYSLAAPSASVGAAAASGSFQLSAGTGCSWNAVANVSWVHTTSSGSGNGTVYYTVDSNSGTTARIGQIMVGGQAFTVNQAAANPPVFVKGLYNGLFYVASGAAPESSGFLALNTTIKRSFSGKVTMDGGSYAFKGVFDATGRTNVVVRRPGKMPLALLLELDGQDAVTGTAGEINGTWLAQLHADRVVFSSANHSGFAGLYTFRIPGDANPAALPGGDSYGTFKVDSNGKVTLSGCLADNTKVTQSTGIAQDGRVPLFVPLYRGTALMMGWIQFATDGSGSLNGLPVWVKLPAAKGYYLAGFNQQVTLSGMKYTAPASRQQVFDFTSGSVLLGVGNLPGPLAEPIQIGVNNKVVPSADIKLRLTLNAAAGKFSGSFTPTSPGKAYSFQGILVRQWNAGFGYFLGTDQSGYVRIGTP